LVFGRGAPGRPRLEGLILKVAEPAINYIALKVFLKLSEEQTDAGVKEATAERPRYPVLKGRA
jgi:hypothetical protein